MSARSCQQSPVYNAAAPFVPSPPFYVRFMVSARFSESVTPSAGAADAMFATVASDRTDTRGSMRVPLCDMVMQAPPFPWQPGAADARERQFVFLNL
jgi:hypothetical protein